MNEPTNLIQLSFDFKKTNFNTYKIKISARLKESWRLYSQKSALKSRIPTLINFEEFVSAVVDLEEKEQLLEQDKLEHKVKPYYYSSVVSIIQTFHAFIEPQVIVGKVYYSLCSEKKGLSTLVKHFQIELK